METTGTISVVIKDAQGAILSAREITPSPSALNAVLFDFNPSGDPNVSTVKALSAGLIHRMQDVRVAAGATEPQVRNAALAISEIEGAQMRAGHRG